MRALPSPWEGFHWIQSPERATQSDRFICFALSGLPRHWISTPGRRSAADAATLCPGLICCCPFGAKKENALSHLKQTACVMRARLSGAVQLGMLAKHGSHGL